MSDPSSSQHHHNPHQQQQQHQQVHHQQQKMLSAVRPAPQGVPSMTPGRGWKPAAPKRDRGDPADPSVTAKTKKPKRKGGKACVYCRRSHMVCEGGRPCERCIKRDIAHLCRDVTPPATGPRKSQLTHHQPHPVPVKTEPLSYDPTTAWPLLAADSSGAGPSQLDFHAMSQDPSGMGGMGGVGGVGGVGQVGVGGMGGVGGVGVGGGAGGWGMPENAEFGILSEMLKTLRDPNANPGVGQPGVPGGMMDMLAQVGPQQHQQQHPQQHPQQHQQHPQQQHPHQQQQQQQQQQQHQQHQPQQLQQQQQPQLQHGGMPNMNGNGIVPGSVQVPDKGKGKGRPEMLSSISRIEQYLLAAADQPDGSRASRLTQVIRAKYEAGLLKPYDYIKGYERMTRWMDSGRAARVDPSRSSSPTKGGGKRLVVPPPPSGSSISPESRRRILAALEVFRPKFRRIAKELTDLDLVFVEEANERLMLQYDRALASIHTPSCIWRRTGEIQKANQEFATLTGIPAQLFRNGQLCVYELMDEDSAVRFWEGYGKVAFDKGQSHMYTHCTLKIPLSLTRAYPSRTQGNTPAATPALALSTVPDLMLPQAMSGPPAPSMDNIEEEYRVIKTCFSMTIRRDRYDIPVAIMGQWIPMQPGSTH